MKLSLVSATLAEISPILHFLEKQAEKVAPFSYRFRGMQVQILITGVGLVSTTYSMTKYLQHQSPDLMIHAGIAGALTPDLKPGEVIQINKDQFADIGIEQADGSWESLFEANLAKPDEFPFGGGLLTNPDTGGFLPAHEGLTIARTTGSNSTIQRLKENYPEADLETMESAAFFYVALQEKVKFLSIRSISNYVEERNKANWEMSKAVKSLNETLVEMLMALAV